MSVLGDYRPRSVDEACWREVRPAVEAVLAGLQPSLVRRARLPFALLAAFVHSCGFDPTVELLLDETLLAQWVTTLATCVPRPRSGRTYARCRRPPVLQSCRCARCLVETAAAAVARERTRTRGADPPAA